MTAFVPFFSESMRLIFYMFLLSSMVFKPCCHVNTKTGDFRELCHFYVKYLSRNMLNIIKGSK